MDNSKTQQLEKKIQRLKKLVYLDPLTNVYNRRGFLELGTSYFQSFQESKRRHRKNDIHNLSIIFLDIDDFKKVNDRYGHPKGDRVLKQLAKLLKQSIRKTDLLARWGGDEFVILFLNVNSLNAQKLAQKICSTVRKNKIAGLYITISAGLFNLSKSDSFISAINQADKLMYQGKKQGKNQYVTSIRRN
ncbi:MAG: GGDEF domain-containing protein [Minisyncoccia bacterium]